MSQAQMVFNPYLPFWEYVPDGEPHVFGNRLYVYGSHDRRNGSSYCQEDYVVWSAPVDDLSLWRCDGVSYRRGDDPRYADEGGRDMMAPDVAQGPDGRFYLFYFNDMKTLAVAVADAPEGPFSFHGVVHGADGAPLTQGVAFDPGVLVDGRGVWLYYGFDPSKFQGDGAIPVSGCFAVELEADMLTCKGNPVKVLPGCIEAQGTPFAGHAFFEASSIRKIRGSYYLAYSSELGHELCYAVGEQPTGPFVYGGTIVSNADVGYRGNMEPQAYPANTHGGLVEVSGQWYVFYHRHTHERQYARQGCAEKIEIAPDGSIAQVEMTSCGLSDGPLPTGRCYPAHIACGIRGPEGVVHISSRVLRRPSDPFLFQEGPVCASIPNDFAAYPTSRVGECSSACVQDGPAHEALVGAANLPSDESGLDIGCMYAANLQSGASITFKYFTFTGKERACELVCRGSFNGEVAVHAISIDRASVHIGSIAVAMDCEAKPGSPWLELARGGIVVPEGVFALRFSPHGEGSMDIREFMIW